MCCYVPHCSEGLGEPLRGHVLWELGREANSGFLCCLRGQRTQGHPHPALNQVMQWGSSSEDLKTAFHEWLAWPQRHVARAK